MTAKPIVHAGLVILMLLADGMAAVVTPVPLLAAPPARFQIEEATIEGIQSAILKRELTATRVVQLYLARIKAYNGSCVDQPQGLSGVPVRFGGPSEHAQAHRDDVVTLAQHATLDRDQVSEHPARLVVALAIHEDASELVARVDRFRVLGAPPAQGRLEDLALHRLCFGEDAHVGEESRQVPARAPRLVALGTEPRLDRRQGPAAQRLRLLEPALAPAQPGLPVEDGRGLQASLAPGGDRQHLGFVREAARLGEVPALVIDEAQGPQVSESGGGLVRRGDSRPEVQGLPEERRGGFVPRAG